MEPIRRLNRSLARGEAAAAGAMVALVFVIMTGAAICRAAGAPLLWADEAAIAAMVWAAFLGAAAMFGMGGHMAITLLTDSLDGRTAQVVARAAQIVTLAFFLGLDWLIWRWFDLPGLIAAGSGAALAAEHFNFLYTEPTVTLGLPKFWLWLVLPLFSLGGTLHGLAALLSPVPTAPEGRA